MTFAPASIDWGSSQVYTGRDYIYALRGNGTTDFYRYSISGNSWTAMTSISATVHYGGSLTYTGGDYIYATRGNVTTAFYRYSISGNSWTAMTSTPVAIGGTTLTYTGGDFIYSFINEGSTAFYRYSISNNSWTLMTATPVDSRGGTSLVYANNYIYALRGGGYTNFWRYSLGSDTGYDKTASGGLMLRGNINAESNVTFVSQPTTGDALSLTATTTGNALTVTQSGTGNIIDLKYSSTSLFTLNNEDRLTLDGTLMTTMGALNTNLIDDMEDISDWTASVPANTPVASETTKVKVNDGAMTITTNASSLTTDYVRKTYGSVQDWSSYGRIGFWIQGTQTGQIISLQFNDSTVPTTSDYDITIKNANEWQYEEWDISGITSTDRDGAGWIQFIIDSVTNTPAFYIDQLRLYNASSATNRMAEFFLDANGYLVMFGDEGVEIGRTSPGSNLPSMKIGSATVQINNPLDLQVEGDIGIEYNLAFLNNNTSYITSAGPLTISAGDSNSYENLTITTSGTGDVIIDIADSASGFKIVGTGGEVFAVDPSGNVTIGGVNATDSDLIVKRNISTQGGNITVAKLSTPANITVTPVGTAGTTTYGYRISAINGNGETLASTTVTTATGNATLTTANYNSIAWDAVSGATGYKIYGRISASELYMATVNSPALTYNDDGTVVTPAGALPASNTTGGKIAINTSSPARNLEVLDNSAPQMRLTYDSSNRAEFQVGGTGVLTITTAGTGTDVIVYDDNLKVCANDGCPAITMSGTGNIQVEGDIYAAGGYKNSFNFAQSNVTASQPAVAIDVLGLTGNTEYTLPYAGSIIGISVASNAVCTAGNLTVDATINGAATGLQVALESVTNTTYHSATQGVNTDTFSAGDRLGVKITTDAGWLPITADIVVTVIIEY